MHRLCHLLNEMNFEAYLVRCPEEQLFQLNHPILSSLKILREYFRMFLPLKTNPFFNTPTIKFSREKYCNDLVIYGEQLVGNPLNSTRVIRYLLHTPGYHTGRAYYGFGEYHVHWDLGIKRLAFPEQKIHPEFVKVTYLFNEIYKLPNIDERKGSCYMVRKGVGKKFIHPPDAICLDGMSHENVARIFKTTKMFYSYDTYTMYSRYAAMCGCISIVVPDENVSRENWNRNPNSRFAIAYGVDDVENARIEMSRLPEVLNLEDAQIKDRIKNLVSMAQSYFDNY